MKLTIVTINYNSSENTIKLLGSLRNQTDKDFEVIVVDNNSADVEKLMDYKTSETNPDASVGTSIIYIKNDRNLGYSGGNNTGIKKALQNGTDWVLLLNNDTWVESSFIEHLKANLEDKGGVVGLVLDEGNRVAYAGQIQWLRPTLSHITTLNVVSPQVIHKNDHNDVECRYGKSVDKLYAIGGAMLVHKSVFDKIGFLDENYFLYFEDADFCQRARKAGIPVSFLKEVRISHSVSASTKKLGSPMLLRYHYRNALYFNLKNGPWYIKVLVWPWSWLIIVKQIIKILIGKNKEESKSILAGVMDFYFNKMGKIKAGT